MGWQPARRTLTEVCPSEIHCCVPQCPRPWSFRCSLSSASRGRAVPRCSTECPVKPLARACGRSSAARRLYKLSRTSTVLATTTHSSRDPRHCILSTLQFIMSSLRIARAALRARPAAIARPLARRGYADVASDKIKLSLALPHQVRSAPSPSVMAWTHSGIALQSQAGT